MTVHQTTELLSFVRPPISVEKMESLVQGLQDNIAEAATYSSPDFVAKVETLLQFTDDLILRVEDLEARLQAASEATTVKGLAKALKPSESP